MTRRRCGLERGLAGGVLVALALLVTLAGCGIPRDDAPRPVPSLQLNPALPTPSSSPTPASPTSSAEPAFHVAFLQGQAESGVERLVLVPRPHGTGGTEAQLQGLLAALVAGPGDAERARGLATALPNGARLAVTRVADGVADVDIASKGPDADPQRLPLSVAQIVLTLTSHPGVDAVRLIRDGSVVEAPLPGGQLTAAPLTASDYATLLAPSTTAAGVRSPTVGTSPG